MKKVDTTRTHAAMTIAAHELRTALRGRMIPAFAALYAVLAIGIALAGLAGSGQILVQGFTRTSVSLLTLSLYLLPLLGALLGATAFSGDDGGTELLLAQPIGRGQALLGRTLGMAAALALVAASGFGAAGLLMTVKAGPGGLGGYALVCAASMGVGLVGLSFGVLIGVLVRRRGSAVGWALAGWFAAAVLYDLASIAVLQVAGSGQPGPWLLALLATNPIDGMRALGLVRLGADVLLGPTGAALQRLVGAGAGAAIVTASLLAWIVVPLAAAGRTFRARDF
jgi:Cu-processing system permease protein